MQNIDGALAYVATLDIDDFNVSSQAMERSIKHVSDTAITETQYMDESLLQFAQRGAMYIQSYLVGQGMVSLVNSIIQVRGQFQQLEIAFGTMLGSEEKATVLMNQMIQTAAKTPFDLMGVASGAKQLLAYGEAADRVNDTLIRLGNIASGLSIPLNDIVYLYGTTMVQGRLYAQDVRQFTGRGIPLVRELAEMYGVTAEEINAMVSAGKIGFPEVEKVIRKLTDEGGQFYNLMAKQSAALTGQISNLEDAWDSMINDIGRSQQDFLSDSIAAASYMVEHYQTIIDILKAVAIGYGTLKAATVLNTLATKGYTGVALIDNTVRAAKLNLLKAEATLTGTAKAQQDLMNQAQREHVAALEAELTAEEHANLVKSLRVATIQSLLTAQQAEYLSNLGLTASSEGYEAAAMQVLTVEQREALSKTDLTSKSSVYRAALEQEVAAKRQNEAATLSAMRSEVSAAARRVEAAKAQAVSTAHATEQARYEVYWAKQTGDATAIAVAEKKLEAAQDNQAAARKAALAAQTDFHTKKKILETTATRQSTVASQADTAAKTVQTTATNVLSAATSKATMALRALWATMKANPIGWLVTIIGMAVSAVTLFSDKEEEITEATGTLSNATKKATKEFNDQAAKVDALRKIIDDSNISYEQRNKALVELKSIVPGYNALLTQEGKIINNNTEAINKYLVALEKQIKLKAAQEELEGAYKKKRALLKTEREQSDEYWSTRQTNTAQGYDRDGFIGKTLRFFGAEDETNRKKELEKTQRELNDVNQQINSLNQEISETSVSMSSATTATKSYNEQGEETQEKIATLQKELSDMRSGSVSKDNLANAIQEKERELRAAQSDLAALTGKKTPTGGSGSGSAENNADQLSQKQLEAQRKLEEARIDVMEEGFARRKAILDLQHKKELDEINKEERELAEARKKAGRGALTAEQTASFAERRKLADEAYYKESSRLFDGEIDYKKRQYQAYFKWVENVGKDVADKHFKTLIDEGTSFTSWINSQIQTLEQKKAAGTLTDGDANALNALKIQLQEMTGEKSALELFKESLRQSTNQASNLAEKLKIVADLKDRLERGEFHLNEDDTTAASLSLESMSSELEQKAYNEFLEQYKSYEERKSAISLKYDLMRTQALKSNNIKALEDISKKEKEEISKLASDTYFKNNLEKILKNADKLTVDTLNGLIDKIEKGQEDLLKDMAEEDIKNMLDMLGDLKDRIASKNPFTALSEAVKEFRKDASQANLDRVLSAGSSLADNFREITDCMRNIAERIDDENLAKAADIMDDVLGNFQAAEKGSEAWGGWWGAIIGGLTDLIPKIIKWASGDEGLEKRIVEIQSEIDSLGKTYDRLSQSFNNTFWVFNDEQRKAAEDNIQLINDQINALEAQRKVAKNSWNYVEYAKLTKEIKDLEAQLNKGDMFMLYEQQIANLQEQQNKLLEQIEAERAKKDADEGRISDWEDDISDLIQQCEELERQMRETLAGTSVKSAIDTFANNLVDAYKQGEDAAKALGETTKNILKKAVLEAIKRQFLAKGINDAINYLSEAMGDNVLTDDERATFEDMANTAGETFHTALSAMGDLLEDVNDDVDPLSGAIASMSEETGSVIAGRLNAFIINQSQQTSILRDSLTYQVQIAQNTANTVQRLEQISNTLNRIENKSQTLLSQGIA